MCDSHSQQAVAGQGRVLLLDGLQPPFGSAGVASLSTDVLLMFRDGAMPLPVVATHSRHRGAAVARLAEARQRRELVTREAACLATLGYSHHALTSVPEFKHLGIIDEQPKQSIPALLDAAAAIYMVGDHSAMSIILNIKGANSRRQRYERWRRRAASLACYADPDLPPSQPSNPAFWQSLLPQTGQGAMLTPLSSL